MCEAEGFNQPVQINEQFLCLKDCQNQIKSQFQCIPKKIAWGDRLFQNFCITYSGRIILKITRSALHYFSDKWWLLLQNIFSLNGFVCHWNTSWWIKLALFGRFFYTCSFKVYSLFNKRPTYLPIIYLFSHKKLAFLCIFKFYWKSSRGKIPV